MCGGPCCLLIFSVERKAGSRLHIHYVLSFLLLSTICGLYVETFKVESNTRMIRKKTKGNCFNWSIKEKSESSQKPRAWRQSVTSQRASSLIPVFIRLSRARFAQIKRKEPLWSIAVLVSITAVVREGKWGFFSQCKYKVVAKLCDSPNGLFHTLV